MSIYLRNSKGETLKTENKGKELNLTPEELLFLDFMGDSESVERTDSPVLETNYHTIDGVTGLLVVRNASLSAGKTVRPTNDITVIWGTYRLFKGNVQH